MVTYPNTACACGYRRFRHARPSSSAPVTRWMRFDVGGEGGLGATPLGMFFGGHGGGGDGDGWGEFDFTMISTSAQVVCESCGRIRSQRHLGQFTPAGVFVAEGFIHVVGADFLRTSGCFSLELLGNVEAERHTLALTWVPELPPPMIVAQAPSITLPAPPPGASTVDSVLAARLPDVRLSQDFTVYLVDSCAGTRTAIATITLETTPMIFTPLDADLGGAPRAWLFGQRGRLPAAMVASGVRMTLPFDKAQKVVEYNARELTDPAAQGFAHVGSGSSGDFSLLPGGLLMQTNPGSPSYWRKTVALTSNPTEAYLYTRIQPQVGVAHAAGAGYRATARYAQAVSTPYVGASVAHSGSAWYATELDGSTDVLVRSTSRGWVPVTAYANDGSQDQVWVDGEIGTSLTPIFSNVGTAAALDAILEFGDVAGSGVEVVIDAAVASFGGRFIRPRFSGVAPSVAPVIRLYGMADSNSSPSKLVRMKVRAALGTGVPYSEGTIEAEAVLNATVAGAVYSMDFALTGLAANEPFSFTLERMVEHATDQFDAIFHVLYLTIKSS
jgi:hypothetical protein